MKTKAKAATMAATTCITAGIIAVVKHDMQPLGWRWLSPSSIRHIP